MTIKTTIAQLFAMTQETQRTALPGVFCPTMNGVIEKLRQCHKTERQYYVRLGDTQVGRIQGDTPIVVNM